MTEDKLDALSGQLTDVRVALAVVAADTRAILGRLQDVDRRAEDHETRVRALEQIGADEHTTQIQQLMQDMQSLREWRAKVLGMAGLVSVVVSAVGGPVAAAVFDSFSGN